MSNPQTSRPAFHILLVEDDDDHTELIRRALGRASIPNQLSRVANGKDALRALTSDDGTVCSQPDLVLLDINLPGASGLDVLQSVRQHPDSQIIPIVMLSTSCNEADVRGAYQSYANSYVRKPDDFRQLCDMLNELLTYWSKWNVLPPIAHHDVS